MAGNLLFAHRYEHEYSGEGIALLNEHLRKYLDRGLAGHSIMLLHDSQLKNYSEIKVTGLSPGQLARPLTLAELPGLVQERHLRNLFEEHLRKVVYAGNPNADRLVEDTIKAYHLTLIVNAGYEARKGAQDAGDPDFMKNFPDDAIYRPMAEYLATRLGERIGAALTKEQMDRACQFYNRNAFKMLEQGIHSTAANLLQELVDPSVEQVLRFHKAQMVSDLPRFEGDQPLKMPLEEREVMRLSLDEAKEKVRLHAYGTLKNMVAEMTPAEQRRLLESVNGHPAAARLKMMVRANEIERATLTSWQGRSAKFISDRQKEFSALIESLPGKIEILRQAHTFTPKMIRDSLIGLGARALGIREVYDRELAHNVLLRHQNLVDKAGLGPRARLTGYQWDLDAFVERQVDLGNFASAVNVLEAYQTGGAEAAASAAIGEVTNNLPGMVEESLNEDPGIQEAFGELKGLATLYNVVKLAVTEKDPDKRAEEAFKLATAHFIPGVGQVQLAVGIGTGIVRIGGRMVIDPLKDDMVKSIYYGYTETTQPDGTVKRVESRRGSLLEKIPLRLRVTPEGPDGPGGLVDLDRDVEQEYQARYHATIDDDYRHYKAAYDDGRLASIDELIGVRNRLDELEQLRATRQLARRSREELAGAGRIDDARIDAQRQNVYLYFHDLGENSLRKTQPEQAGGTFADRLGVLKGSGDETFRAFIDESFPQPSPQPMVDAIDDALGRIENGSVRLQHPERVLAGLRAKRQRLLTAENDKNQPNRAARDEEAKEERELIRPILAAYVDSWFNASGPFADNLENLVAKSQSVVTIGDVKAQLIAQLERDYFISRFCYFQALRERAEAERALRRDQARRNLTWRQAAQELAVKASTRDPSELQVIGESFIFGRPPYGIPPVAPEVEITAAWFEEKDVDRSTGRKGDTGDSLTVRVRVTGSARQFTPPFKIESVNVAKADASAPPSDRPSGAKEKRTAYKVSATVVDATGTRVGTGEAFLSGVSGKEEEAPQPPVPAVPKAPTQGTITFLAAIPTTEGLKHDEDTRKNHFSWDWFAPGAPIAKIYQGQPVFVRYGDVKVADRNGSNLSLDFLIPEEFQSSEKNLDWVDNEVKGWLGSKSRLQGLGLPQGVFHGLGLCFLQTAGPHKVLVGKTKYVPGRKVADPVPWDGTPLELGFEVVPNQWVLAEIKAIPDKGGTPNAMTYSIQNGSLKVAYAGGKYAADCAFRIPLTLTSAKSAKFVCELKPNQEKVRISYHLYTHLGIMPEFLDSKPGSDQKRSYDFESETNNETGPQSKTWNTVWDPDRPLPYHDDPKWTGYCTLELYFFGGFAPADVYRNDTFRLIYKQLAPGETNKDSSAPGGAAVPGGAPAGSAVKPDASGPATTSPWQHSVDVATHSAAPPVAGTPSHGGASPGSPTQTGSNPWQASIDVATGAGGKNGASPPPVSPPSPPTPAQILASPRPWENSQVRAAMNEWLSTARAASHDGNRYTYTEWGVLAGPGITSLVPDHPGKTREEWLWTSCLRLTSENHGTLGDYVRAKLDGRTLTTTPPPPKPPTPKPVPAPPVKPATDKARIGERAPNFKAYSTRDLSVVELDRLRGKIVLVGIWDAGIAAQRNVYRDVMNRLAAKNGNRGRGLVVLTCWAVHGPGSSLEEGTSAALSGNSFTELMLNDEFANAYAAGVKATPSTYLIDADGVVRQIFSGINFAREQLAQIGALLGAEVLLTDPKK